PSASGHMRELRHDIEGIDWQPHDTRRTFARVAESLDISRYALKSLLNHSQPKDDQTGHYIEIEVERLREPMERITAALQARLEPKPKVESLDEARRKKRAKAKGARA